MMTRPTADVAGADVTGFDGAGALAVLQQGDVVDLSEVDFGSAAQVLRADCAVGAAAEGIGDELLQVQRALRRTLLPAEAKAIYFANRNLEAIRIKTYSTREKSVMYSDAVETLRFL